MSFHRMLVALFLGLLASGSLKSAHACADELDGLVGYTIMAATQVDGDFEGCDFDRVIRLTNGSRYRCSGYSYTYAFMPDAIVFAKPVTIQGKDIGDIRILIDDEIYDMHPVIRQGTGK